MNYEGPASPVAIVAWFRVVRQVMNAAPGHNIVVSAREVSQLQQLLSADVASVEIQYVRLVRAILDLAPDTRTALAAAILP